MDTIPQSTLDDSQKCTQLSSNSSERFYDHFQTEYAQIQGQIKRFENEDKEDDEVQSAIDSVLVGITNLSNQVSDNSQRISAYHMRTFIQENLAQMRVRLAPKPKFRFKSKRIDSKTVQNNDLWPRIISKDPSNIEDGAAIFSLPKSSPQEMMTVADMSTNRTSSTENPSLSSGNPIEGLLPENQDVHIHKLQQATYIDISNCEDKHVTLPMSPYTLIKSAAITCISRCVVDMSNPVASNIVLASLTIKNIKDSIVIVGQVDGAAHVTKVEDSILLLASRQVRVHECHNVKIYLHSTSRPIIEDCRSIQFAPIPQCLTTSTLEEVTNQWDQVDDFKWLRSTPSPNWSVLPEEERLSDVSWTELLQIEIGQGLLDKIKLLGVGCQ
ncbi:Bgt-1621 [Blumeria graminis f. sp. tritici]|uniref:Bgt-1621 n=2 Tax=Blumeria graminis f. sp. tritici TaxID=62690 RepID=A0A9X9MI87_BLUGR|nr:Tubulin binding cofactor C [Blumeria graminis f. sp. tritici 96224]VDB88977.1 Bgt-1621 [Blumeria graminis f. sp. tritici]